MKAPMLALLTAVIAGGALALAVRAADAPPRERAQGDRPRGEARAQPDADMPIPGLPQIGIDDDDDRPAPPDRRMGPGMMRPDMMERLTDELADRVTRRVLDALRRERDEDDDDAPPAQPLGRSLRLTFELTPRDDKDAAFFVNCATTRFEFRTRQNENGMANNVEVEGGLALIEGKDDEVLLTYGIEFFRHARDSERHVETKGSIQLKYGKAKPLLQVGDKTLTIKCDADQ